MMILSSNPGPKKLFAAVLCFAISLLTLTKLLGPPSLISQSRGTSRGDASIPPGGAVAEILAEHPVKRLVREARVKFEEQAARQSKSFDKAASVYVQRYQRSPPPGFELWFNYAMRHHSLIIDDFDLLNEYLAPFWHLSGAEVKSRLDNVRKTGPAIRHCQSLEGRLSSGCECLGREILRLLKDTEILSNLPEVDLLVNALDEPRILPGGAGYLVDHRTRFSDETSDWTDSSHLPVWNKIAARCNPNVSPGMVGSVLAGRTVGTTNFSFLNDHYKASDLCSHPEYSDMHGLWMSPTSFKTTTSAVPILSPAVLSTMGDIPLPAPAYTNIAYTYDESEDKHWENKTAGLYWAGSTTGGFQKADGESWKRYHRQRFVSLVSGLDSRTHVYLQRSSDNVEWRQHNTHVLNHSLYNVHFTDVIQFSDDATDVAIRKYFKIYDVEPKREAFKYTLTFDLDGNGHSGRFYRLLNSRSLPLKQTVFREWHDDRLQPWQHYVPISLGMEELPEVVRYLVGEEEGRELAALLAENGRQWSLRALRPVDQVIYLYRLMLELSRLQDPTRPASR
jgi:hypothetical protein